MKVSRLSSKLGIFLCLVGSLVLTGWEFNIEAFKRLHPLFVAMNPLTAVCFVLGGLALIKLSASNRLTLLMPVQWLAVGVMSMAGISKLTQNWWGWPIAFDQVLFHSELSQGLDTHQPNQMALPTATCFIISAFALALAGSKNKKVYLSAQVVALLISLFALSNIFSYFYNIPSLFKASGSITMALHTSLSFLFLNLGIIFLQPHLGLNRLFSRYGPLHSQFENLRLQAKLLFGFGSLIFLFLIFALSTFTQISAIQQQHLPARANVRTMKLALSEMKRYEKEFLAQDIKSNTNTTFFTQGTSENLKKWETNYQLFLENLTQLDKYQRHYLGTKSEAENAALREYIQKYHTLFGTIIEKYRQRGFSNTGLEGIMIQNAQTLSLKLSTLSDENVLSKAREAEKDFFLTKNVSNIQKVMDAMSQLRSQHAHDQVTLTYINNYENAFIQIVNLEKQIGLDPTEGLTYLFEQQFSLAQPILEKEESLILTSTQKSVALVNRLLILMTVIFILVGIGFANLTAQLVVDSVKKIQQVAEDIATGNMEGRISVSSSDELGALAISFNKMASKLEKSHKDLALKNATLEAHINQLQNTKKATFNILEDLENTKAKIELEKAKDEAILNSMGDGLIAIDDEGKVLVMNQSAQQLLGITNNQAQNQDVAFFYDLQDEKGEPVPYEKRPLTLAIKNGQKTLTTFYYVKKDGSKFPAAMTVTPVILDGQKVGAIEVFRNISKEKEVDRMKTEFISLASHQLRTPLTAMRWFSEMLLNGDAGNLNPEQKEYVQNISDSNQRMIELVNSLLNISRIESGRIIIDPQPTHLGKLVEGVITELTPKISEKQLKIILSIHPHLPEINIDPKLIRQVYINLLSNSIKYTPAQGEISVFISQKETDIISLVSDTGYGIPFKEQHKVFSKFYRGENIAPIVTDGTGLGLYLTKAIVESSGGRIWFKSEENKGTSFWVSIPLKGSPTQRGKISINS